MRRRSKSESQPEDQAASGDGAHLLIVENDPDTTELLTRLLAANGFRATSASDASDAFVVLEHTKAPIDLVVVDLPAADDASNIDVLEDIRLYEDSTVSETPVVVICGADEGTALWQSDVDGLLARPFRSVDLINAIDDALQRTPDERTSFRTEHLEALEHQTTG